MVCVEQMPGWQISGVAAALMIVFRAPPASGCTTMCALSHRSSPSFRCDRKEHRLAAGSIWGRERSPRSHSDERLRLPPPAETCLMPSPPWPKRIVSPCQLIPYGREASRIGTAGPPPTLIRLIVFGDQNAIERPSRENTGSELPQLLRPGDRRRVKCRQRTDIESCVGYVRE